MSNTNYVFVIDTNKKPLQPCKPSIARRLLNSGKAAVWRRFPFTLILKKAVEKVAKTTLTLKIDPGSRFTGIALLEENKVIWMLLIQHRGSLISEKLQKRSQHRRARRTKNLRYRKPGNPNKKKPTGWLAPSLVHRVETTMTWVKRLIKFSPVESISMELVRFDTQLIQNPEITGLQYQQGELAGYELREYLLEKWGRQCASTSGKTNTPLEVEHIHPKSKGGSDRVSNLTVACTKCNQIKSNQDVKDFLSGKPELLKRILTQARLPLKDAAAVNSTRWKLFNTLKTTGLTVITSSGGQTKFNRRKQKLPKAHCIDAACVGEVN
ncbi:MAG: HNH endonuclease, partial [Okeania sp. SIO3B5]|uniref:RNA-guided endonuclease IscB n=1 Tax=Okeania sp. SIO3B5 TaxID=2607811 RepID=UPI0014008C94